MEMKDKSVNVCAVSKKEGGKEIVGYDSYILMYIVWYLRKKAKERAGIVTVTVPLV
jgi:hypothetical protein